MTDYQTITSECPHCGTRKENTLVHPGEVHRSTTCPECNRGYLAYSTREPDHRVN